jgi:hypothetical protein
MTRWNWPQLRDLDDDQDGSMTDRETVSMGEAAERLGLTIEEVFDLVFDRVLRSIAAPSGRRIIPLDALEDYRRARETVSP